MPTKRQHFRHIFQGGFDTESGVTVETPVDQFGRIIITHLLHAENVRYELDGGPHKIGGTVKLNSTALESGAAIRGLFDYWKTGTAGTPVQKRVIHINDHIYKDDADGTFTSLASGLSTTAVPNYNLFDDILIIASDSTVDVPKSWDQTTFQNLAGTPPNFAFSVTHKGRVFAAGDAANPSKLYYCVEFDPEDWAGAGSGSIQVDPGDGDKITGLVSHRDELWVFKGPKKGSIHRITGSAPTGTDVFAKKPFIRGIGAVSHNTIFRFADDVGFVWSDGSIRSLKAVEAFGDFNEASLSRSIATFIENNVDFSNLQKAWAINDDAQGSVLLSFQSTSASSNDLILMYDYRFNPGRWALWTVFNACAMAMVLDPDNNDMPTVMIGSDDGFVMKLRQPSRSIDDAEGIPYRVTTPFLHYGAPLMMKTLAGLSVGVTPGSASSLKVTWRRDSNTDQVKDITFADAGDQLAPSPTGNDFTLGTSTLSSGRGALEVFVDTDEGGEFRGVQYEFFNGTINQDIELHTFSTIIEAGSWSEEQM